MTGLATSGLKKELQHRLALVRPALDARHVLCVPTCINASHGTAIIELRMTQYTRSLCYSNTFAHLAGV
jgi:hypothetical protein